MSKNAIGRATIKDTNFSPEWVASILSINYNNQCMLLKYNHCERWFGFDKIKSYSMYSMSDFPNCIN